MVVAAFPVAKLGTLLLRQISKPIANFVKEKAKTTPFFRTYICMPPAQLYNWCEVKMKMWVMNLGKPVNVPTLNEAMAIELGANLLGESIIFVIAASILYMEYARQVRKEAAKEQGRLDEIQNLNSTINELYFQAERQDAQIRELSRILGDIESKMGYRFRRTVSEPTGNPSSGSPDTSSNGSSGNLKSTGLITNAINYVTLDIFQNGKNR